MRCACGFVQAQVYSKGGGSCDGGGDCGGRMADLCDVALAALVSAQLIAAGGRGA
jgi:hypothetical protein